MTTPYWTQYLNKRCEPKAPTLSSHIRELADEAAKELSAKYKWRTYTVAVSEKNLHLDYTIGSGLFTAIIPMRLVLRTLTVKPHMELVVKKHNLREMRGQNKPQKDTYPGA